jgi:transglutaminase-like putative cysteine protease
MWLRETKRIVCIALISAAPAFAANANVPDWVRQAASQTLPTYPSDTNAVVLLDDTTYTVNGPADFTEHYRRVVKILRPDGRKHGMVGVDLRKDEKLNNIHAWSIDSSGHEYEVKDKEFAESALFTENLYDDIHSRTARAPASDPGTVVAVEYDIERRQYFNELQWYLQEDIPVRQVTLTLQLPSSYEYKEAWANTDPVEPVASGSNRWQWTKSDIPAIEKEEHRPYLGALAARMKINYFGAGVTYNNDGWDALGKWVDSLLADRRGTTPEMVEKVRQLTAGKQDFDGKARAISEFIQSEVRYVAIEIGIGGHQPHPAPDVFRYRYGDCKDKANLMSTMLRESGLSSEFVVINTHRGVARQDFPSLSFDHAILAIDVPPGTDVSKYRSIVTSKAGQKLLLFDPTDPYTPLGEISADKQDRYALLVTAGGGEVIHTPILDPEANRIVRRGIFSITPEGSISGNVTEARSGEHASDWRGAFHSSNEQERTKSIENSVTRSLTTAKIQNIKLEALDQRNADLVTRYDVSSDRYAQITGPFMLVRPRVIGRLALGLEKKERKYSIELHSTSRDDDEFAIEIPAGYVIDDLPEPIKAESSFGTYESHINKEGSKIIYKRTFINRSLEVPKDKIAEFRAFQNRIAEDESAVVVLKKAN